MIRVGQTDFIDLPEPSSYTPGAGIVRNPRTKVLNSSVAGFTQALAGLGYGWEAQPMDGTPYTVVTTITAPNLTTTWELDGNDLEKPIWYLPRVRHVLECITDLKARAIVRRNLEAFTRGDEMTDATGKAITLESLKMDVKSFVAANQPDVGDRVEPGEVDDVIDNLIGSIVRGVESFPLSTYVLRKTQVVVPNSELSPGFEGSNDIVTTARLKVDEPTIPKNLFDTLPDGYWQKKTPQATQGTDGRWTYRREFWWAQEIDPFLYIAQG